VSSGGPQLNLGGLASGLDTNAIVQQLLAVDRQPQVRLQLAQTLEKARQQALRDVTTRLDNLLAAADALKDPTAWADVQTVDSSDATHLTATRTGGAAAGAYVVTVTKLAAADQYADTSGRTTAAADDTLHLSAGGGADFAVTVTGGDTLATIAARINGTSGIRSTPPSRAAGSCSPASRPAPRTQSRSPAARRPDSRSPRPRRPPTRA
jgi:flagellar hook-associated protein 2